MKIVLIGAGSFVFAPTVLEDAIVRQILDGAELALVDVNEEAAEAMAAAGRRIAGELGVGLRIRSFGERRPALEGADYVIVAASPQGAARWRTDHAILQDHGMADQARECGGMGGLLHAFRSITLLMDICRDMEALCPTAVLMDVTNPMPRVVTAVHRFSSIRACGFCNIAYQGEAGYAFLPALVGRKPEEVSIVTAGLNHFAWLLRMTDRNTGEDLIPAAMRYLELGDWSGWDEPARRELTVMRRWLGQYGGIAAGAIDHHAEYLPFQPDIAYPEAPPYHGEPAARERRMRTLRSIAEGRGDWQALFEHRSWEHPVVVAAALGRGERRRFDMLNLPNDGYLRELPPGRIVEVPATVRDGALTGEAVPAFPSAISKLLGIVSDVHELAAEAAATGNVSLAVEAILHDPAIADKKTAVRVLRQMLEAHRDMLVQFQ